VELDITTKEIHEFLVDDQGKAVILVIALEPVLYGKENQLQTF